MAPPKKSKKDLKKLKKKKNVNVVPIEPRAVESDWWDTFWHKNSSCPANSRIISAMHILFTRLITSGSAIPSGEEEGFRYFFRMSKKTFDYICSLVREDLISRPPSGLINIEGRLLSVEKQVAIALRRLASGESQVSVGASFGVGQSTVSQVTWRVIESLEEHAKHHLKWPNTDQMEEIKSRFQASYGLPNCSGAIGATHIAISLPAVQVSDEWRDHAKNYSMLLQGIVDHEMRFLDVVTGWPGGMPIYRMLKCCGFYKLCENGARLNGKASTISTGVEEISIREYIVGGASYPLLPWLLTPYQGDGSSSDSLSKFRAAHEAARSLASKAFSQLKGNWRILSKVMWRPDTQKLPSIIVACCLLHNIILDRGDSLQADMSVLGHHDSGYMEQICKQVDPMGRTIRDNIAKYLQLQSS
ncbi:Basic amino-acid permease [Dionaea muscipula]